MRLVKLQDMCTLPLFTYKIPGLQSCTRQGLICSEEAIPVQYFAAACTSSFPRSVDLLNYKPTSPFCFYFGDSVLPVLRLP